MQEVRFRLVVTAAGAAFGTLEGLQAARILRLGLIVRVSCCGDGRSRWTESDQRGVKGSDGDPVSNRGVVPVHGRILLEVKVGTEKRLGSGGIVKGNGQEG